MGNWILVLENYQWRIGYWLLKIINGELSASSANITGYGIHGSAGVMIMLMAVPTLMVEFIAETTGRNAKNAMR
jgi:hypothetical protein